ncbi:MAG: hypothetical protein K2X99_02330 [Gemmatimonadaceae bacterium]|nr:hypothetical protein [Gemmatimonadaceae bacterium]
MTLLELTVALAVGGMAVLIGGGTIAELTDRRAAEHAERDAIGRSLTARRSLEAWLSGARLVPGDPRLALRGTDGVRTTPFGRVDDDRLAFLTDAATPVGDGPATVSIALIPDGTAEGATLEVRFRSLRTGDTASAMLAPNVSGFDVQYFTRAFGVTGWRDDWDAPGLLPGALQLRLAGDAVAAPLRLPITIPLANGR